MYAVATYWHLSFKQTGDVRSGRPVMYHLHFPEETSSNSMAEKRNIEVRTSMIKLNSNNSILQSTFTQLSKLAAIAANWRTN